MENPFAPELEKAILSLKEEIEKLKRDNQKLMEMMSKRGEEYSILKKPKENIVALVPCRLGSQRVKNKNTRNFAGESLLKIKLNQLLNVPEISRVIVSTNDPEVIRIAKEINTDRIDIEHRENYYASSECTNDEFVRYFANKLDIKGHLLFTHVTSPFVNEETYSRAIRTYLDNLDKNDSLISVKKIQGYVWDKENKPVTYDLEKHGRWPKTQTIEPIHHINSGIFLIDFSLMKEIGDRVGENPYYFETNDIENLDIDWLEDFHMAEKLWEALAKIKSQGYSSEL